jgi:hypothetical protein
MNLVSWTIGLPLVPLRGLLALARVLQDEAEQQLYSPAQVRRELEEVAAARAAGELPEGEAERTEEQVIERLLPDQSEAVDG